MRKWDDVYFEVHKRVRNPVAFRITFEYPGLMRMRISGPISDAICRMEARSSVVLLTMKAIHVL